MTHALTPAQTEALLFVMSFSDLVEMLGMRLNAERFAEDMRQGGSILLLRGYIDQLEQDYYKQQGTGDNNAISDAEGNQV